MFLPFRETNAFAEALTIRKNTKIQPVLILSSMITGYSQSKKKTEACFKSNIHCIKNNVKWFMREEVIKGNIKYMQYYINIYVIISFISFHPI
jgi:hypothetical protein